jgi:hypothetical protein
MNSVSGASELLAVHDCMLVAKYGFLFSVPRVAGTGRSPYARR